MEPLIYTETAYAQPRMIIEIKDFPGNKLLCYTVANLKHCYSVGKEKVFVSRKSK